MCPDSTTKRCTKCGETKPLSEFQKRADTRDGYAYQCKACCAAYDRARQAQRTEQVRNRYHADLAYREKVKARVRDAYATSETYRTATVRRATTWGRAHKERVNENARHRYHAYHGVKDRARRSTPEYQARKREWERKRLEDPEARKRLRWSLRQHKARRRSWLKEAGSFTQQEWDQLCVRFDHRCAACGAKAKLTIDHIVPLSKGGKNTIDNIQPLCRPCNTRKNARHIDYRPLEQAALDLG